MLYRSLRVLSPLLRKQRYLQQCAGTTIVHQFRYASTTPAATGVNNPISSTTTQQHQHEQSTEQEVAHHAALSKDWWNENGGCRGLHSLNKIRVPFIRDGIIARGSVDPKFVNTTKVLQGKQILEVGCGGGILTEQLARIGANVTGIDLGEDVIRVAREHLEQHSPELRTHINYKIEPIEVHAKSNTEQYDAVVISEVLEHISDKATFLTDCVQALKPGGSVFITTLNKTVPLWIGAILIGEYVIGMPPKGTHHWDKLISPIDTQRILDSLNCQTVLVNGSVFDYFRNKWIWTNNTTFCYALQAVKAA